MRTELEAPAIPPAPFARQAGTTRVTANANIFNPRLINRALETGLIDLKLLQRSRECQSERDRLRWLKNTTANPIFPFCNKICRCHSV